MTNHELDSATDLLLDPDGGVGLAALTPVGAENDFSDDGHLTFSDKGLSYCFDELSDVVDFVSNYNTDARVRRELAFEVKALEEELEVLNLRVKVLEGLLTTN